MDIKVGKVSYNPALKSLTWENFKKFWEEKEVNRSGVVVEKAAKLFGIEVPMKHKKGR